MSDKSLNELKVEDMEKLVVVSTDHIETKCLGKCRIPSLSLLHNPKVTFTEKPQLRLVNVQPENYDIPFILGQTKGTVLNPISYCEKGVT